MTVTKETDMEQLLWVRTFDSVEELRRPCLNSRPATTERHGHQTSAQARARLLERGRHEGSGPIPWRDRGP